MYASALAMAHRMLHMFKFPIAKQEAELTILYNFYIDCMPSDDMAEVSPSLLRSARGGIPCPNRPHALQLVSLGGKHHPPTQYGGQKGKTRPWREQRQAGGAKPLPDCGSISGFKTRRCKEPFGTIYFINIEDGIVSYSPRIEAPSSAAG